ncbi:unnamed protein product [Anisakis simplex]|uniref:IMS_C domain-containing protein n=1 Tax=Anisakis simplex TaxID=6269 RepID=A0A0M3K4T8_ANISI|nr:unnamed protein product [Anisakis simplex]
MARVLMRPAPSWRLNVTQKCSIYDDEPLHAIMDRVCEICHEMYSHKVPNMRVECSFAMYKPAPFSWGYRISQMFFLKRTIESRLSALQAL